MTLSKTTLTAKSGWLSGAALLAVILLFFFWQSFLPGYVHFNNDTPLGVQAAASARLPAEFAGSWFGENSIGIGGAFPVGLSGVIRWVLRPVGYAKFYIPIALFILGLGAWYFFKQLRLSPLAAILGALATLLNSAFFSTACWGVASQQLGQGLVFFALALAVSLRPTMSLLQRSARIVLAGFALGLNFDESADIGALFNICAAVYMVYHAWAVSVESLASEILQGIGRVCVITVCAVIIAAQGLAGILQTQIQGVVGTKQDSATKAEHWDFATQWSFPKSETLSLIVPGLFGYRLSPESKDGSEYWGQIGRAQAWDRYFEGGRQGPAPGGFLRQVGGGNYQGVLVVLVALWTMLQSFRKKDPVFTLIERRLIWFWVAAAVVSLLLAFGRYAPFYRFVYALPYFSTMRNPTKYLYILRFATVILFAYGIHGLSRRYLEVPLSGNSSWLMRLKSWWPKATTFDRNWVIGSVAAVAAGVLGWFIYAHSEKKLEQFLETF